MNSEKDLGKLGKVNTVVRSLFRLTRDNHADIKALMSKADILIDLEVDKPVKGAGWADLKGRRAEANGGVSVPLLLLYAINARSEPVGRRKPLDAVTDVLAIGIVYPKAEINTPVKYKRVVLPDTEYEEPEALTEEQNDE